MKQPNIINIQRYSLHDGDGIRTTIFFKGCPLSCTWCHNPESQSFHKQPMIKYESCTSCGNCITHCHNHAISIVDGKMHTNTKECDGCEECTFFCPNDIREVCGKEYTTSKLMDIIDKDEMFYEQSGGGVTLSGGEVMAQDIDFIVSLAENIKEKGYNLCIDTCGYAPTKNYERIVSLVDMFLYDIKTLDKTKHKKYTGKDNTLILENLEKINLLGAKINIRIPIIGTVNDDDESIKAIGKYLTEKNINVVRINLLPYHKAGNSKYTKLGKVYEGEDFYTPSSERMEEIKRILEHYKFSNIHIGG